jgi:hypothetical protein
MDNLRLALVSTPRSGNCWLRHMLAQVLELDELAVHLPDEVNWQALPDRVILAMHWLPDEAFVSLLEQHGFRPIVLARHPLDVLISILVFSQHDDSTLRWLGGAAGNERCIEGASPMSEAFLAYATGPRAKALLSVSADWWQTADVCRVRYEDLVSDTAGQLSGILSTLGVSPRRPPSEVIAKTTPEHMRALTVEWLYHVWQAQGGLWKRLLTAPAARRICEAHQTVLNVFGYPCDPDDSLGPAEAQRAWEQLDAAALKRTVNGLKSAFVEAEARHQRDVQQQRADSETLLRQLQQIRELNAALQEADSRHQQDLQRQRADLDTLARQFADLPLQQIRELSGLGSWSVGAARTLQRWSRRFPRVAGGFKSLVIFGRWTLSRLRGSTSGK